MLQANSDFKVTGHLCLLTVLTISWVLQSSPQAWGQGPLTCSSHSPRSPPWAILTPQASCDTSGLSDEVCFPLLQPSGSSKGALTLPQQTLCRSVGVYTAASPCLLVSSAAAAADSCLSVFSGDWFDCSYTILILHIPFWTKNSLQGQNRMSWDTHTNTFPTSCGKPQTYWHT